MVEIGSGPASVLLIQSYLKMNCKISLLSFLCYFFVAVHRDIDTEWL